MTPTISPNDGEREAFEAWRKRTTKSPDSYDSIALHGFGDDANYADRTTRSMWVSWQARATLAAAPLEGAGVPVAVISERALQRLAQGKSHCVHAYAKVVDEDDVQLYRAAPQPEPSLQPPAEATNRPSKEWYRRKIAEVGDADVMVGPAFQPPAEASEPFGYVVYDNLMGWRFHKEKPDGISAKSRLHTVFATPQPPAPVVLTEIRDTLEAAKVGLDWYRDACPELDSGADDEMFERIDKTIEAVRALEAAHQIGDKP